MKKSWIENIIAGSYALALHIILVVVLIVGVDFDSTQKVSPPKVDIVQATVLDEATVLEDIKRRREADEKAKQLELEKQAEITKKLEQEKQALERQERERLEKIEQEKRAEQQRQQEIEKQKQLEIERQQAELEQQRAEKAKQEKLVAEKKKKEEQARKLKQEKERQAAEEKKRKVEAERKKKEEQQRKAEEEKKRKAEQEKKRKEAEEAKKREADRLMQEALATEQREQEERRVAGIVDQYSIMIQQRVKRYWINSANVKGLQCTLNVSLLPGGDVKQVTVVKSSGNSVFDRSAESAVYKAAPLPQPSDPKAATALRNFTFIFRPE